MMINGRPICYYPQCMYCINYTQSSLHKHKNTIQSTHKVNSKCSDDEYWFFLYYKISQITELLEYEYDNWEKIQECKVIKIIISC